MPAVSLTVIAVLGGMVVLPVPELPTFVATIVAPTSRLNLPLSPEGRRLLFTVMLAFLSLTKVQVMLFPGVTLTAGMMRVPPDKVPNVVDPSVQVVEVVFSVQSAGIVSVRAVAVLLATTL